MLKKITLLIFFLSNTLLFSQEEKKTHPFPSFDITQKKHIKNVLTVYEKELNLSKEQKKIFLKIILKYNFQYQKEYLTTKNNSTLNKIFKLHDLEIYKLLNKKQFKKFKKIRNSIESYKKYRI